MDELQPFVFVIAGSMRPESVLVYVCNLLNSGVMKRAEAASVSLSRLGGLFSYASGGDESAKRNAKLLRSAKFAIDIRKLRKIALDPFSDKTAFDTVEIRLDSGYDNSVSQFRLAGGHTEGRIKGEFDVESLFAEIRIQFCAMTAQSQTRQAQAANAEHEDSEDLLMIDEAYVRVRKVFDLANQIFKAFTLGWELENNDHIIEFSSQTPEQPCTNFYGGIPDAAEIDHVHDIMRIYNGIARHDSLMARLDLTKRYFPVVSFLCPLNVMKQQVFATTIFESCS